MRQWLEQPRLTEKSNRLQMQTTDLILFGSHTIFWIKLRFQSHLRVDLYLCCSTILPNKITLSTRATSREHYLFRQRVVSEMSATYTHVLYLRLGTHVRRHLSRCRRCKPYLCTIWYKLVYNQRVTPLDHFCLF